MTSELSTQLPPVEVQRFGKYEVLCKIGTGGMAEIFKCRLSGIGGFDKVVVVKRMLPELLEDKDLVHMFLDEARIAANLSHPNIVQIYEIDQLGETPYIAMEYARGPTLSKVIHESWKQHKPCARIVAKVLSEIAGALSHAHNAVDHDGMPLNIVHRDVTPHNIVVSTEGVAKLLDFGVAKAAGRLSHTNAGGIKGKFRYMAPEQLRTDNVKVDGRADVFAMGVCLYLAATGSHAYPARNEIAVLKAAAAGAFPRPSKVYPDIDPELERIILWAMSPSLARRCPNALALQQALDAYVSQGAERVSNHEVGRYLRHLFGDLSRSDHLAWSAYNDEAISSKRFSSPVTDQEIIEQAVDAAANDAAQGAPVEIELADMDSSGPIQVPDATASSVPSPPLRLPASSSTAARSQSGRASLPTQIDRSQPGRGPLSDDESPRPRRSRRLVSVMVGAALWLAGVFGVVVWNRSSARSELGPRATPAAAAPLTEKASEAREERPTKAARDDTPPLTLLAAEEAPRQETPRRQGRITVVADTLARVLMDGRYEGTTPWKSRALSVDSYTVEVQAHGYPPQQRSISVVANKDLQVSFRFAGKRPAVAAATGRTSHGDGESTDAMGVAAAAPTAAAPVKPAPAPPPPSEATTPRPPETVIAPVGPTSAPPPPPPTAIVAAAPASATSAAPTDEPKERSYDGPISSCPEGASLAGAEPPAGTSLYCQLASGAKHGKYLRWYANGQRAETGEYMNGKKNGRWVEFYEDGSEREKTQWRRGVKTW